MLSFDGVAVSGRKDLLGGVWCLRLELTELPPSSVTCELSHMLLPADPQEKP